MAVETIPDLPLPETGDAAYEDVRDDGDQSSGKEDGSDECQQQQRQPFISQRVSVLQDEGARIEQQFERAHVVHVGCIVLLDPERAYEDQSQDGEEPGDLFPAGARKRAVECEFERFPKTAYHVVSRV